MSDLTIRICDFYTKSKSAGKTINKASVLKVINSDRFKKNLEAGRILGLATHKSRYEVDDPNIPMEDQILTSPYLANCARKIWIDESKNTLMGEFDLLDTQYGRLFKDMFKKKIMIPVSMSVSATSDANNYYVEDLLGVDFTERPDLNAAVEKVNFSNIEQKDVSWSKDGKQYISFSAMLQPSDYEVEPEEIECCPDCGNEYDNCTCKQSSGIYFESQSNLKRPKIDKPSKPKCNVSDFKPISNQDVPENEPVVTNLDSIAGEDTDCITPVSFANTPLGMSLGVTPDTDVSVSMEDVHKDIPVEDQLTLDEINKLPTTISYSLSKNFSLTQFITEMTQVPAKVLRNRINEVIQYGRSNKQEKLTQHQEKFRAYIGQYILGWVDKAVSSKSDFNIGFGLGLNRFNIDTKLTRKLNLVMKKMKQTVKSTGFITKPIQQEMLAAYQDVENAIYDYIDDQVKKVKPENEVYIDEEN